MQRILPSGYQATYAVLGSRIRASALGKGPLFHAPSLQLSRQTPAARWVSSDLTGVVLRTIIAIDARGVARVIAGEILRIAAWAGPRGPVLFHAERRPPAGPPPPKGPNY